MTDSQDTNKQQQEPMAIHQFRKSGCSDWYDGIPDDRQRPWLYEVRTLYTSPPASKPWVGLTPEDHQAAWDAMSDYEDYDTYGAVLEAKLRERNEHREKNA